MKSIKELNQNKKLSDFQDDSGLIGNRYTLKDGAKYVDPGDALQRTGYIAIAQALTYEQGKQKVWNDYDRDLYYDCKQVFRDRLDSHRIGRGLYVRHRHSDPWAGRLDVTSGDQIRPLIIALGLFKMRKEVALLALQLIKRLGFYWNSRETGPNPDVTNKMPDWSGPEHWTLFIRAMGPVFCIAFLPLLLLGDLIGLIATLQATFRYPYEKIKNCDQLNRIAVLTQGIHTFPTPISKLSHYIFKTYRPVYRLLGQDFITETHTYRTRYWQDFAPKDVRPNVADYINESYFWNVQDPNIHTVWYNVTAKYWSKK